VNKHSIDFYGTGKLEFSYHSAINLC